MEKGRLAMENKESVGAAFAKKLTDELDKIGEIHGEQFKTVARGSFNAIQAFNLMILLTKGHEDNDYEDRVQAVLDAVGGIVSTMLSDLAVGMGEDAMDKAMKFADEMGLMQLSMFESIGATKQ